MALTVYKKGQGTAARGIAGVVAILLGTWACVQMWNSLTGSPVGMQVAGTAVVAAIFVGVPLYLILFYHQVVDILVETQQEMRKVAWSSRSEVIGATTVVLVTVIILAVFILVTDLMVRGLFILIRLYG